MSRRRRSRLSPAEERRRKHLAETMLVLVLVVMAIALCFLALRS